MQCFIKIHDCSNTYTIKKKYYIPSPIRSMPKNTRLNTNLRRHIIRLCCINGFIEAVSTYPTLQFSLAHKVLKLITKMIFTILFLCKQENRTSAVYQLSDPIDQPSCTIGLQRTNISESTFLVCYRPAFAVKQKLFHNCLTTQISYYDHQKWLL